MSVLLTVAPKCTLAACMCPLVSHGEYADGTGRQTDGGTSLGTLRFPLDAANVESSTSYPISSRRILLILT